MATDPLTGQQLYGKGAPLPHPASSGFGSGSSFGPRPVDLWNQGNTPGPTPGPTPAPAAPPPIVNTAQNNPNLNAAWQAYQARIEALKAREGQGAALIQGRMAGETEHLKNAAATTLAGQAAAAKDAAIRRAAQTGGNAGVAETNIESALARSQAQASRGIDAQEVGRLDALTLAQLGQGNIESGNVNQMIAGAGGQANLGANNLLAQNAQGLAQWQAYQQAQAQQQGLQQQGQQNSISNWLQMMRLYGT